MRDMFGNQLKSPVAFCRLHRFGLSPNTLKIRRCLEKRCYHLRRMKHPYWEMREDRNKLRKQRKQKLNGLFEKAWE